MLLKRFLITLLVCALCVVPMMSGVAEESASEPTPSPTVVEEQPTQEPTSAPTPEATQAPEVTQALEATLEPEVTQAPKATSEPEATQAPEATTAPEVTLVPAATEVAATAVPKATVQPASDSAILVEGYQNLLVSIALGKISVTLPAKGYAYWRFVAKNDAKIDFTLLADAKLDAYLFDDPAAEPVAHVDGTAAGEGLHITLDVKAGKNYILAAAQTNSQAPVQATLNLQAVPVVAINPKAINMAVGSSIVEVVIGSTYPTGTVLAKIYDAKGTYRTEKTFSSGAILLLDRGSKLGLYGRVANGNYFHSWSVTSDNATIASLDNYKNYYLPITVTANCSVSAEIRSLPKTELHVTNLTATSCAVSWNFADPDDPAIADLVTASPKASISSYSASVWTPGSALTLTKGTPRVFSFKPNLPNRVNFEIHYTRAGTSGAVLFNAYSTMGTWYNGMPTYDLKAEPSLQDATKVELRWKSTGSAGVADGATTRFVVRRGLSTTTMTGVSGLQILPPDDTSSEWRATDAGLAPGTYYYSITPMSGSVAGKVSTIKTCKINAPAVKLIVQPWGTSGALLTWTNLNGQAVTYRILKDGQPCSDTLYDAEPCFPIELEANKACTLQVVATLSGSAEIKSNIVTYTPRVPSITLKTTPNVDCSVLLQWNAVGAQSYQLMRSTSSTGVGEIVETLAPNPVVAAVSDDGAFTESFFSYLDDQKHRPGTYYYYVVPTFASGEGAPSARIATVVAWQSLTLTATSNGYQQVSLSWPAVSGASYYTVAYGPSATTMTESQDFYGTKALLDTGINGNNYLRINYTIGNVTSSFGPTVFVKTAWGTIQQLTGVTQNDAINSVELSWLHLNGAKIYNIYRQNGLTWTRLQTIDADFGTSYLDSSIGSTTATSATYRVTPYAESPTTGTLTAGPYAVVTVPLTKSKTVFTKVSSAPDAITLEWKPIPGATSYKVQRSTVSTFPVSTATISMKADDSATFTDTNIKVDTTYYYRVMAVGPRVPDWSAAKAVKATLAAPNLYSVVASSDPYLINVAWTIDPGASGYNVYASSSSTSGWWRAATIEMVLDDEGNLLPHQTSGNSVEVFEQPGSSIQMRIQRDVGIPLYIKVYPVLTRGGASIQGTSSAIKSASAGMPRPGTAQFNTTLSTSRIVWEGEYRSSDVMEIECAYDNSTTYTKVGEVKAGFGSFVHTNIKANTGLKYRIRLCVTNSQNIKLYSSYASARFIGPDTFQVRSIP